MTSNDFHLFLHLKTFLEGEVLKSTVENWLDIQAEAFYDKGMQKLMPHYALSASILAATM